MLHSKASFSEIIERFLRKDEDQNLQIFIAKVFYLLRGNQNEDFFDFFFDYLLSSSEEMYLLMLLKLCSWKFYKEELSEIYSRQFKQILVMFLSIQSPSKLMTETLRSASCIVTFDSLYKALLELDCVQIIAFLSLWINSIIPNNCIESSIMASFPKNDIIKFLEDKCENMVLSDKFKAFLKEKSESENFDVNIWKSFIDTEDGQFGSKLVSATSTQPDYEEIRAYIQSDSPTDIAFGMYCLRQMIAENSKLKIEPKFLNSIISCLFHDERYT